MASPSASAGQQRLRHDKITIAPPADIPRLAPDDPRLVKDSIPQLLDHYRPLFASHRNLQALDLDARQLGTILKNNLIVSHFFNAVAFRHIRPHPNGDPARRIVVLNVEQGQPLPADLDAEVRRLALSLVPFSVELGWDQLTSDAVLEAILPSSIVAAEGVPTGFTIVGHIAHLNLIDLYLPFRFLVGAIILEKNATSIRTVVNKLDSIDTQFRFFKMELLAGDDDYTAHVSESDCSFSFDFRTVYWNSRLHGEHARLIRRFRPNQVISDVMAGVGPFAVPAAKRGAWVLANDLNPKSYESLCANARANHVLESIHQPSSSSSSSSSSSDGDSPRRDNNNIDGGLVAFCQDGREFIRNSAVVAWQSAFPGRIKGFGMGEEGDERLREHARRTVKARAKAKRVEHARRHEAKVAAATAAATAASAEAGVGQGSSAAPPPPPSVPASAPTSEATAATTAAAGPEDRHAPRRLIDHFVMNLPASALEFLDAFRGLYTYLGTVVGEEALKAELEARRRSSCSSSLGRQEEKGEGEVDDSTEELPWIHVHCFSKDALRPALDVVGRANRALGLPRQVGGTELVASPIVPPQSATASRRSHHRLPSSSSTSNPGGDEEERGKKDPTTFASTEEMMEYLNDEFKKMGREATKELEVHYVRDVAPNKQMYCLSFRVPREVLFAPI